jgi:hypothetical protein
MSDGEAPEYKEGDRRTSQDRVSAVRARAGVTGHKVRYVLGMPHSPRGRVSLAQANARA